MMIENFFGNASTALGARNNVHMKIAKNTLGVTVGINLIKVEKKCLDF